MTKAESVQCQYKGCLEVPAPTELYLVLQLVYVYAPYNP